MNNTATPHQEEIQSLPTSLQKIVEALHQEKELKPSQMVRIIREAEVQVQDLEPWADLDHPAEDSYGRKLVHKGPNFEVMVMSWQPGDFSTIHDHGHTQWGAVQIFGPAEHATFRLDEGHLTTLARWTVKPGDIIGVSHSLIHQMGNPTKDKPFLSLHIYGIREDIDNVTGDARIFDLEEGAIHLVDGGVFFALPEEQHNRTLPGLRADFPTRLRHMVELIRRVHAMGGQAHRKNISSLTADAFALSHQKKLLSFVESLVDENDHQNNSIQWKILNLELKHTATLQRDLLGAGHTDDQFHQYAEFYDSLIGQPCLDAFMGGYLRFFSRQYQVELGKKTIISLGCGTGLIERFMMDELGVEKDQIYGIDISQAMVEVARQHLKADVGDVLTLDPDIRMWDIAFSGLNVFHYLDYTRLEEAIQKTAAIIQPGGYFVGDFITPDHIRWYPNVMYSKDKRIISLRSPRLVEDEGRTFQESEITNVSFLGDQLLVNYAGKHRRFLPPMNRVRTYFEKAFGGKVDLYDAHSLERIPDYADSCPSTRYVVVAEKGA